MALILAILSLLTALVPIADREFQVRQQNRPATSTTAQQFVTAFKPVLAPQPPEAGQPNVVFRHGEWWKFENGQWLVWRNQVQLAQGGSSNVVR